MIKALRCSYSPCVLGQRAILGQPAICSCVTSLMYPLPCTERQRDSMLEDITGPPMSAGSHT